MFKDHLVQSPCNEQGHVQPDQVAQSPVHPDVEYLQAWGIFYISLSNLGHCFNILLIKNIFLISSVNLLSFYHSNAY